MTGFTSDAYYYARGYIGYGVHSQVLSSIEKLEIEFLDGANSLITLYVDDLPGYLTASGTPYGNYGMGFNFKYINVDGTEGWVDTANPCGDQHSTLYCYLNGIKSAEGAPTDAVITATIGGQDYVLNYTARDSASYEPLAGESFTSLLTAAGVQPTITDNLAGSYTLKSGETGHIANVLVDLEVNDLDLATYPDGFIKVLFSGDVEITSTGSNNYPLVITSQEALGADFGLRDISSEYEILFKGANTYNYTIQLYAGPQIGGNPRLVATYSNSYVVNPYVAPTPNNPGGGG
jgi:hypothetical protein